MRRLIAGLLALALLLLAAGLTLTNVFHGTPEDALIDLVPGDAVLYTSVYLDPSTSQGRSLQSFIARLEVDDASGLLDQLLEPCGTTFDEVEGTDATQVAVFVLSSGARACVSDGEPLSAQGAAATVSERWVGGDGEAVTAAQDTTRTDSLAENETYLSHLERVPFDRIALFYRTSALPDEDAETLLGRIHRYVLPVGVTAVGSTDGRLVLQGSTRAQDRLWSDQHSVELSRAPGEAWLALALPPLDVWLPAVTRLVEGSGFDVSAIAEPLNRAIATLPDDPDDVAVGWAAGRPAEPSFGLRFPEGTTTLFGPEVGEGGLAARPEAREALGWLQGHPPVAYYDGKVGGQWASLLTALAGIDLSLSGIERAALGVSQSGDAIEWQLVVSASEPNG